MADQTRAGEGASGGAVTDAEDGWMRDGEVAVVRAEEPTLFARWRWEGCYFYDDRPVGDVLRSQATVVGTAPFRWLGWAVARISMWDARRRG